MNYYKILEVDNNATNDEIKKSFRKLSLKYHPDRNGNNPEFIQKIQEVNEAYEILGDPVKRQSYDFELNSPFQMGQGMGQGFPMDSILEQLFFGRFPDDANIRIFHNGMPMHLEKPTPIVQTINIQLDKVLTGATVPVDIERWIIENGNKIFEKETLYVNIIKGIDDNEIIILRDKGNVVNEHCKGDVKIFVKIENNSDFKRMGLDLVLDKKITLKEALCGFSFDLKYINGKIYTINNNKGNIIPNGYKKLIPNMGLTRDEHTGNLIIIFLVEFPEKIEIETLDAIQKLKF
jgi:DnaJ family protein A protein 2